MKHWIKLIQIVVPLLTLQRKRYLTSAGGTEKGGWTYRDETWYGNNLDDHPSRWPLLESRGGSNYCLSVKGAVPAVGRPLIISDCDWSDERQLFFWEEGKRFRPYSDPGLCVDAGNPDSISKGDVPRLKKCALKGPQQRWNVVSSEGALFSPRADPGLCLTYPGYRYGSKDETGGGERVEFGLIDDDRCIEWSEEYPPGDDFDDVDKDVVTDIKKPISEYVMIVNLEENEDGVVCLAATNADRGEVKLVKCDKTSGKHLWIADRSGNTMKLKPKSDPNLCLQLGDIDKDPKSIHCCVDDTRIRLKACKEEKTNQQWRYRAGGHISPKSYATLCVNSWFPPDVGISYCDFPAIHEESYDGFRWDMVDPDGFRPPPLPLQDDRNDMINIISKDNARKLKCSVSNDWSVCEILDDPNEEDEWNSVDTVFLFDDKMRIRSGLDLTVCLTYDEAYRTLKTSQCYEYRDKIQRWKYDSKGNKELSLVDDASVCAVNSVGENPPVEQCNGQKEQSWKMIPSGGSADTCSEDDEYTMLVLRGAHGYYCVASTHYDEGSELDLRECDANDQSQLFLMSNTRWKPSRNDENYCVDIVQDEDDGVWIPTLMPCVDGRSKQKWKYPDPGGTGTIRLEEQSLCATLCEDRYWWQNFCLRRCTNGDEYQRFELMSPEDYTPPLLKYVHLSTENDSSWGISCYPDVEENTCPGYRPIRTTYGKFHKGSIYFIEETKKGIRFRRGEPLGEILAVDGEDTWQHNKKGNKELSSAANNKLCIDNRGGIGEKDTSYTNCPYTSCYGTTGDLTLAKCNGKVRQRWALQDADEFKYRKGSSLFGVPPESKYRLVVSKADRSFCMAAKDSYARHPDGDIILARCNPKDPKQIWAVQAVSATNGDSNSGPSYRLKDNLSLCMHVSRVELLQTLHLEECDSTQAKQVFFYDRSSDSNNGISPQKDNSLCVGYQNRKCPPREGNLLELIPCARDNPEQKFDLVEPEKY